MKRIVSAALVATLMASSALAQPPERGNRGDRGDRGGQAQGQRDFGNRGGADRGDRGANRGGDRAQFQQQREQRQVQAQPQQQVQQQQPQAAPQQGAPGRGSYLRSPDNRRDEFRGGDPRNGGANRGPDNNNRNDNRDFRGDNNRGDNRNFGNNNDRRGQDFQGRGGYQQRQFRDRDRGRAQWDQRRYQQSYRFNQRFRIGAYRTPPGYYNRSWGFGDRLPFGWFGSSYYLNAAAYGLPYPPIGCEWVRVGDDAILVDVWSGQVLSVYYDLFW